MGALRRAAQRHAARVTVAGPGWPKPVNLQEAQRRYDKIAWLPEPRKHLSYRPKTFSATIAYRSGPGFLRRDRAPCRSAGCSARAQRRAGRASTLNKLLEAPADLADTRAQVAAAENALDKLTRGPQDADVRSAELGVRQALLDLDGAKRDLAAAKVVAPLAGTVLALNVEPGEQGSGGQAVATLADTSRLNLIVNVEQTDVPHIAPGQEVTIVLYALPDQVYKGEVERIAPGVTDTKQSPSPSPSP
ncbi:MAG: HlyD family efflux transporter periplasmic adaptor subunit [Caldilineaceae bacterium]